MSHPLQCGVVWSLGQVAGAIGEWHVAHSAVANAEANLHDHHLLMAMLKGEAVGLQSLQVFTFLYIEDMYFIRPMYCFACSADIFFYRIFFYINCYLLLISNLHFSSLPHKPR